MTTSRFPVVRWAAGDGSGKADAFRQGDSAASAGYHECNSVGREGGGRTGPFLLDDSQDRARALEGMSCHGRNEERFL